MDPLSFGAQHLCGRVGGWNRALPLKKIVTSMDILVETHSCNAMKQFLSGVNQMLAIWHRSSRQN